MSAAAAKRTVLAAASLLALVALLLVGASTAAPPDKDRTDPGAPTNLRVSAATQTTLTLAWDPATDDVAVSGYYVFGYRGKATVEENLDHPSYTASGLTCGQTLSLTVFAFDAAGNRSQSASATVSSAPCTDSQPPSAPTGFIQLSTAENAVVLAWTPSTDNVGVVSYGVYRNLALVQSRTDPEVALSGLSCGTTYPYAFDAVDAAGNRSLIATAYVRTSDCPTPTPTPTPDPEPTPTPSGWSFCSDEWARCTFSGSKDVRYGANGTFTTPRTFADGVECTNAVFGDPLQGTPKHCEIQGTGTGSPAPAPTPSQDTQPPSTPSALSASNVTQTALVLTWSASSDNVAVTGYDLARDGSKIASPTSPSASVSGLSCSSSYTFSVRARDGAGNVSEPAQLAVATAACSQPAPPAAPDDTQAPTVPASLAVSAASSTSVSLSWKPSSDNVGVAGYRNYRDNTYVSTAQQTTSTIAGLACGSAHTFEVNAFDEAGNSSARTSVIGSTLACADTQAPSAPSNVSVSSRTATSIALIWSAASDNVGVTGYGLYRSGAAAGQATGTTGIFTGLSCNSNYTLAVDAQDAAGNRSPQTTLMVSTTACPDTQAPSAPSGLSASSVTQSGLTLSWSASSDNVAVTGYDLYRNGTKVASPQSTSASQTGLSCGSAYTFGVEALDAAGNRSARTSLSVTSAACSTTTSDWVFCANENQRCSFTGSKSVRYGANGSFTTPRTFSDGVDCSNAVFGDPLVGTAKQCQVWGSTGSSPSPSPSPSGNYLLDENFDAIDSSRWQTKWWWNGDTYYHDSDELQAYRDYNATVSNGVLALTARREGVTDFQGRPHAYTSGLLQSNGIQNGVAPGVVFTYGKIEARIKMPAGQGFWPAFWLCNAAYNSNCNHEIDIMEWVGKTPYSAAFNYHWNGQNLLSSYATASQPLSDDFHTYGLEWRPGKLIWYMDGVEAARYEGPEVSSEAHYIILNLAVGGSWPGSPDATTPFPSSMLVDWVRVTS